MCKYIMVYVLFILCTVEHLLLLIYIFKQVGKSHNSSLFFPLLPVYHIMCKEVNLRFARARNAFAETLKCFIRVSFEFAYR